ncbi:hypothetical protein [Rhodoplanes azumiensis]|uniref:Oxaloacetate decarboxylase, gamma chain n=1 Tax=Rhodoplanes azumiensis TaxID=1897628 RepID=A0ABW5AIK4_9BRAD
MTQEMGGLLLQLYGSFLVSAVVAALTAIVTVRIMTRRQPAATTAAVPAAAPAHAAPVLGPGVGADDLAVIAAIAAAAFGSHRIVYIGEARPGSGWISQARTRHHASHSPYKPNNH